MFGENARRDKRETVATDGNAASAPPGTAAGVDLDVTTTVATSATGKQIRR